MTVITETDLSLPLLSRGKVRDTYDLGDKLLFVTTDRISAFDVVLPCGIPEKGNVLNQLSAFWFEKTKHIIPNHLIETICNKASLKRYSMSAKPLPDYLIGRSMVVKKAKRLSIEAVIRGYLAGSAWDEYKKLGTISGVKMPSGLNESQILPEPLFTPTTKEDSGHDLPLSSKELDARLGKVISASVAEKSLAIYHFILEYAKAKGIIFADTKFEFGFVDDTLILIDEIATPDSSRFWDANNYKVGTSQPSFDKQPVRDWLSASGWNKEPPAPMLPDDVIKKTTERYKTVYKMLVGKNIDTSKTDC
jgi:phosphoribosylaminoimidazole-succinocarboxamide synthase